MNQHEQSLTPAKVESVVADAAHLLQDLFPQTVEAVRDMEAILGATKSELPESLRDSGQILQRVEERERQAGSPVAFGKLLRLLRTQHKLTVEQLANRVDLHPDDLLEVEESEDASASPLVVSAVTKYFKLQPKKVQQVAGLTKSTVASPSESLRIAACASPAFDTLSRQEKKAFKKFVKQLKRK